jgi:hypothetical protein
LSTRFYRLKKHIYLSGVSAKIGKEDHFFRSNLDAAPREKTKIKNSCGYTRDSQTCQDFIEDEDGIFKYFMQKPAYGIILSGIQEVKISLKLGSHYYVQIMLLNGNVLK